MTLSCEDIKPLFAEFPKEAISWRAQSVTKDGSKAMALAYIDARDVMDRLDQICGSENWQDRYEFDGPRTICYLSIRIDGEWITKADGAGDTQVEAEKGSISGAFKRAAVKWGIGRYLYDMPAPWVPCESYKRGDKFYWQRWKSDPWQFVKGAPKTSAAQMKRGLSEIEADLLDCQTVKAVLDCAGQWKDRMASENWTPDYLDIARAKFNERKEAIKAAESDDFPGDTDVNGSPLPDHLANSHQRPLEH